MAQRHVLISFIAFGSVGAIAVECRCGTCVLPADVATHIVRLPDWSRMNRGVSR